MKSIFVFMMLIVTLFALSQTCEAKKEKKPTAGQEAGVTLAEALAKPVVHVIPQDVQNRVNALAEEIGTLALQKQLADAQILARQNAISYILDMWKVSVGILEKDFQLWEIQAGRLIKK